VNFLAVCLYLSLYLMISAPLAVGSPCREIIGDANSLAAFLTEPIRSNDPFFRLPPVRVDFHNFPRHPLNTSFFRVGDFHLGPEMGRPFRRPLSIKLNWDYRVGDWIGSTLFIHLIPLLRHDEKSPPERDEVDRKGMELLLRYTQKEFGPSIQTFRNDVSALEEELKRLFVIFDIATGDEYVSTVLARYDGNFEVIGGIASPEHPVVSFRRRIKEMQSVLSED
jgi:hypothetical protein